MIAAFEGAPVAYYTRVLSKQNEFPPLDELAQLVRDGHPDFKLTIESGEEEEWETILLSGNDEVEVAVIERNPVTEGSVGQDEIAELLEDIEDRKPESAVEWLHDYLSAVRTVYAFQHLQGADTEEGGEALHALRSALWKRGESILQADGEGFTNEDGYHIVWQFSDSVSGPWKMAVLEDGVWHHFTMDLGDPDHRAAFFDGEVPADLSSVAGSGPRD
jgi:hypothetical protein